MIALGLLAAGLVHAQKKVLFVMSAADELPLKKGKSYKNTGVFLSEFYLAYKAVLQLGYEVEFATPGGQASHIDKESFDKKYWKGQEQMIAEATRFVQTDEAYRHPIPLQQALARVAQYAGLVVPGGQGLMVDLLYDSTMKQLLVGFAERKKCIGLICHAPALLTALGPAGHPLQGYRVNAVSGLEEWFIESFVMKGRPQVRKIGKQLKRNGYIYRKAGPAKNFAVKDRLLVTSQNPFSHQAFGQLFQAALLEYEAGANHR